MPQEPRDFPPAPDPGEIRRTALAVAVLTGLDLEPGEHGVVVAGVPPVQVPWDECTRALAGADPAGEAGRDRLARWLRARRLVADASLDELAERARPVGLPVDHPLNPGVDWVQHRVLGDVLDLGVGFVGLDRTRPDDVAVVPDGVLRSCGIDAGVWWPTASAYLEDMGAMAVARWRRDPGPPLRPMGDCDVVTLLGSVTLRSALAGDCGGMRAIAAPMRSRGWLDLRGIDPAFALTAAALTDPAQRGFSRPLLLTRDEIVLVPEGGRPEQIVLRDPTPDTTAQRDVLYR